MNDLQLLLQNGADANAKDVNDFTLLMSFTKKNDLESIKILLEYGASINAKDHLHFSALDYAIKSKNLKVTKVLVQNGATITANSYMYAINSNNKEIIDFFDTLDPNKHVFLKNKNKK
jgi:ankyrin repeat protein